MPRIRRVLETILYCDDLPHAAGFYETLLQCAPMLRTPRVVAFDSGEGTVLLLFDRRAAAASLPSPGGMIPGHTGSGPAHIAFAIDRSEVTAWEQRLGELGIGIESRVHWERGGESLYFRDPEGHSVELATPGTWPCY
jgi:catechol 2,3-dioxygenase-like lactoylglutathione lyase family enzyme